MVFILKLLANNKKIMSIVKKHEERHREYYAELMYNDEDINEVMQSPALKYTTLPIKINARKILVYVLLDEKTNNAIPGLIKKAFPVIGTNYKKGMAFDDFVRNIGLRLPKDMEIYLSTIYTYLTQSDGLDVNEICSQQELDIIHLGLAVCEQRAKEDYYSKNSYIKSKLKHYQSKYEIIKKKGTRSTMDHYLGLQIADSWENVLRCNQIHDNDLINITLTNDDVKVAMKALEDFMYPSEEIKQQMNNSGYKSMIQLDFEDLDKTVTLNEIESPIAGNIFAVFCRLIQVLKMYNETKETAEKYIRLYYKRECERIEEKENWKDWFQDKTREVRHQNEELQQTVNQLQVENDKLSLRLADELAEKELMKEYIAALESANDREYENNGNAESEDIKYPEGTVLWGGHPRWQKHFIQKHPEIKKVVDGIEKNLSTNIFSETVPLVLINTGHMAHSSYFRYMPAIKKAGIKYEYI